jgi:hypothetical protein
MLKIFVIYCAILWAALVFADYRGYAFSSLFGHHRHDSSSYNGHDSQHHK